MVIYKCTFPNGKVYIGQTSRKFEIRKKEHTKDSFNVKTSLYNIPFYRAIRKFGVDNLMWDIIDNSHNIDELNKKEIFWIHYYNSYTHSKNSGGYNSNLGGGSNSGYKATDSTKSKIRESGLGDKNSNAKLTSQDVLDIVELSKRGVKQIEIANMYDNVVETTINKILSGYRWSSVTGIEYNPKIKVVK